MPFSHRVFCRDRESPSLSELLVWLRQRGYEVQLRGGSSGDLLSSFWEHVELDIGVGAAPLSLTCLRADASGVDRMNVEVADFVDDIGELSASAARALVLDQLAATRSLLIVEIPSATREATEEREGESIAEAITALFVERARGLAQRDGVGFIDEDDEVVLPLG